MEKVEFEGVMKEMQEKHSICPLTHWPNTEHTPWKQAPRQGAVIMAAGATPRVSPEGTTNHAVTGPGSRGRLF